jgi:hypothetical protein
VVSFKLPTNLFGPTVGCGTTPSVNLLFFWTVRSRGRAGKLSESSDVDDDEKRVLLLFGGCGGNGGEGS